MSCKSAPLIAAMLLLGACNAAEMEVGSPDPSFGESSRWNKSAQVVDPDPLFPPGSAEPGADGAKGAKAVERYRTDRVKSIETLSSSSSGGSGGGSGPQ